MSAAGQAVAAALRPCLVFISYSHKDDELREKLVTALIQLKREGLVESWDDRETTAGKEWAGKIDERLDAADVVICLVSPDFLGSDYCYDIELRRALERHDKREVRVVPIILRPCDWKNSPLGRLKALPKDGKPVVDWRSADDFFLDVAQGLRAIAQELRPVGGARSETRGWARERARSWRIPIAIAAAALVLLGLAAWLLFARHQRSQQVQALVARGNGLLDVGRYQEAGQPFQGALNLEPANTQAKLGVRIADLDAHKSDGVAYQQGLKELLKQWPKDSHLRVLNGDSLLAQGDREGAVGEYSQAIKMNKDNAEAHFRLGVIDDKEGKLGHALEEYQTAVGLSPYSPQYRNNLADAYFKHGEYEKAISEYGQLDRFPLAALESGKIHRLLGRLDEAREQELTAIGWLGDKGVTSLVENQLPWYFTHADQGISIAGFSEKLCYARFEVGATMFLQGDTNAATDNAKQAREACGVRSIDVKTAVRWDLERVANERDELKVRAEAYSQLMGQ